MNPATQAKQIYDPIHGFIEITPTMLKIIDTSEFQRLRDLRQLGAVQYIYPSATHTRFEHSIGVSHLAGIMATHLFKDEILPQTTHTVCELIKIAGLIHDIGHGPFSHLYDSQVRYHDEPEHEERGCEIFKHIVKKYNIPLNNEEVQIIIDMVNPPKEKKYDAHYQIIANKINQIDVDKIDYIQRDCFHIGLKFGGEWSRLLTMCRVSVLKQRYSPSSSQSKIYPQQITWPKKLEYEILQLFTTRYRLHKQVYNHHAVKAYEYCIAEILKCARQKKINFIDLTDSVVTCRLHADFREMQEKIAMRQIPKLVGEKILSSDEYKQKKHETYPRRLLNIIVDLVPIGFASSNINPLDKILFHDTKYPDQLYYFNKNISISMPQFHKEIILRCYNTDPSKQQEEEIKWNKSMH